MSDDVRTLMSIPWDAMVKITCFLQKEVLSVFPLCLKTKLEADTDMPGYHAIMRTDVEAQRPWLEAVYTEVQTLYQYGVYETVDRSAAKERQIVPSHCVLTHLDRPYYMEFRPGNGELEDYNVIFVS